MKKSSKDCSCKCTEELLEKLEHFKHQYVYLFEGADWIVFGKLERVKDEVVKVEYGYKFSPSNYSWFWFEELYVSGCEITEFIPVNYYVGTSIDRQEILDFINADIGMMFKLYRYRYKIVLR